MNCSYNLVSDESAQELDALRKDFQRWTSDTYRDRKCFEVTGTRLGALAPVDTMLTDVAKDGVAVR